MSTADSQKTDSLIAWNTTTSITTKFPERDMPSSCLSPFLRSLWVAHQGMRSSFHADIGQNITFLDNLVSTIFRPFGLLAINSRKDVASGNTVEFCSKNSPKSEFSSFNDSNTWMLYALGAAVPFTCHLYCGLERKELQHVRKWIRVFLWAARIHRSCCRG